MVNELYNESHWPFNFHLNQRNLSLLKVSYFTSLSCSLSLSTHSLLSESGNRGSNVNRLNSGSEFLPFITEEVKSLRTNFLRAKVTFRFPLGNCGSLSLSLSLSLSFSFYSYTLPCIRIRCQKCFLGVLMSASLLPSDSGIAC